MFICSGCLENILLMNYSYVCQQEEQEDFQGKEGRKEEGVSIAD